EQAHVELGPDEVRRLRVTAASWFRRRGDVPEAMNQLLDAAAWPDAIELVRTAGHQFFQRGESATLAGWLSRVDREQPDAPAAVGMNLLAAQIAACQFVAAGETYWRIAHRRDTTPAERVAADALYTCCGIDHVPAREVIDVASRVLASLPDVDLDATTATDFLGIGGRDTIEILPASMMGLATFHQGDLAAGAAILEWVRTLQGMQYPIWRVNVLGALALVQAWRGQLTEALRLGSSALEAAAAVGARHHVAVTSARLALGLVSIHRNDLAEAALQLGVAEPLDFRVRGATDHDTRALLTAQLTALTDGPAAALQQLAAPARGAVPPAILHRAERALRAQWQLAAGDPVGARLTLQPDGSDPVAHPMRFDVELSAGDTAAARTVLDRWRPDASNFLETTSHAVRRAALLEAEGETEPAARTMLEAVALAEPEGLLRPLLDYPGAVTLIALVRQKRTSPFITRLVEADRAALERRSGQSHLVDPLTARELELLVHLPTRMSNADIGRATYMSVNTVKTHLRRIYRKLDVNDRDAAVERAKSLGLL
ncbi:MAG: LuxR C-terminal-related transcriptional regulator, partial [Microthrixaceae bacterium]